MQNTCCLVTKYFYNFSLQNTLLFCRNFTVDCNCVYCWYFNYYVTTSLYHNILTYQLSLYHDFIYKRAWLFVWANGNISNCFLSSNTAWKVSVFGVFLVRVSLHLDWIRRDTQYISVFSPNAGKYGPEKLRIRNLISFTWLLMTFTQLAFANYQIFYKKAP